MRLITALTVAVSLGLHVCRPASAGTPTESDEMRPQWFDVNALPFDQMWLDDRHWYPRLLADECFSAHFKFRGHDQLLSHSIRILSPQEQTAMQDEDV